MVAEVPLQIILRGGCREAFYAREDEVLVEGPARTGKTYAILQMLHMLASQHPGFRGLIVRKTAKTLATSCLETLENAVYYKWDHNSRRSIYDHVHFFGGSGNEPEGYVYDNGSMLATSGMDNPEKIKSSEFDVIFFNEATEGTVEDWEYLLSRLSKYTIPQNWIIGDCNPSAQSHFLNVRADKGIARRIKTRLQDNPRYYQPDGTPTEEGAAYVRRMANTTGNRYDRLVLGLWTGIENAIYPHFDRSIHVRPLEPNLRWQTGAIGVDYGKLHSCGAVAITIDQYGRRWVREAWGEPADDHGAQLSRQVGQMRSRYNILRGMTDPNQDVLAGNLGFKLAPRPRNPRIQITSRLLNTFPGGRVPSLALELNQERFLATFPQPPFLEPDSPGLLFAEGYPGIDQLCDQIEAYHEVFVQNEVKEDYEVARIDEDLVAGMEYGNQCLETVPSRVAAMAEPAEESLFLQERRRYTRQIPGGGGYIKV